MAEEATLSLSTSSIALSLLISLYKNPLISVHKTPEDVPEPLYGYTNTQTSKLTLKSGQTITGENTIAEFLGETQEKLKWTPALRAEIHEWLSRSKSFTSSPADVYVRHILIKKLSVGI